jgi:hypothetical protein
MCFVDGCVAQYKNRKNFIDIIFHEQDFVLSAECYLLTASHGAGKWNMWDGENNEVQILYDLFNYCRSNIHNLTVFYVQEEQVLNYKKELVPPYSGGFVLLAERVDITVAKLEFWFFIVLSH